MDYFSFIRTFAREMNKNLYIISGCNGAGKTTASYTVLPEILDCKEFVNADEIARGLSPFNPDSVAIEAGRLMLKRIEELLEKDETNRRYVAGICNLFNLFMQEVDSWVIFDNSENPRKQIASGGRNADTIIDEELLYSKMQSYVK